MSLQRLGQLSSANSGIHLMQKLLIEQISQKGNRVAVAVIHLSTYGGLPHVYPHLGRYAPKVGLKRFHTFGVGISHKN